MISRTPRHVTMKYTVLFSYEGKDLVLCGCHIDRTSFIAGSRRAGILAMWVHDIQDSSHVGTWYPGLFPCACLISTTAPPWCMISKMIFHVPTRYANIFSMQVHDVVDFFPCEYMQCKAISHAFTWYSGLHPMWMYECFPYGFNKSRAVSHASKHNLMSVCVCVCVCVCVSVNISLYRAQQTDAKQRKETYPSISGLCWEFC